MLQDLLTQKMLAKQLLSALYWIIALMALMALTTDRVSSQWTQMGGDIEGSPAWVQLGIASAISGDGSVVAVGIPGEHAGGFERGRVKIYKWQNGAWTNYGNAIDGDSDIEGSGGAVSLSYDGNIVAIGSPSCTAIQNRMGRVRVFQYVNGNWVKMGSNIDGKTGFDYFGRSIAISNDGGTFVAGAPGASWGASVGAVRAYQFSNGAWVQLGLDVPGESAAEYFGQSVACSDDGLTFAAGAPYKGPNGKGKVRVFSMVGGNWIQKGQGIEGEAETDWFGSAVALSGDGNRLAVGAPHNLGYKGHVRVYEYASGSWTQMGGDIDGEAFSDESGYAVALSDDGTRVAIGAPKNDGSAIGAGHVRVFKWEGGTWGQVGADIDGEAWGDASGFSLGMSDDGTTMVIGAPESDAGGTNSGQARVYNNPLCAPPAFTDCPAPTTVSTDPSTCSRVLNYLASATGTPQPDMSYLFTGATMASGVGTGSQVPLNKGLTNVSIKAENSCETVYCNFTVQVNDLEKPAMSCPPNISVQTGEGMCEMDNDELSLGNPVTSDNCGLYGPPSNNAPAVYPVGVTLVKWTITDLSNNKRSCTQKVTVAPYECGTPTSVHHYDVTEISARAGWDEGLCATLSQLRIRQEVSPGVWGPWSSWENASGPGNEHLFDGLAANALSHYQVKSRCASYHSAVVSGWFTTLPSGGSLRREQIGQLRMLDPESLHINPEGRTISVYSGSEHQTSDIRRHQSYNRPELVIYPNPVDEVLLIETTRSYWNHAELFIFDAFGRTAMHIGTLDPEGTWSVDVADLPPGQYWLRITDGDQHLQMEMSKR